ncbi:recombinase family protein [Candidatus Falkowbacteria bacterium]|nr:recombinase family protein [Candidatus Falkowbacteria bacterium]
MKKAAIYARVSSELQHKEKTIESQVAELKSQVAKAGDILTKEYIDDGYSGAKLDRPGLEQLRNDLKTDLFDSIYFLNTDRIARDVAYQTIIISEILKYKKQIIINGKDYVHNPENKFAMTVLGAVSELERAKMTERSLRGKMHRLRQGFLLGNHMFGYDLTVRNDPTPAFYTINEKEASIIRYIFKAYAEDKASWSSIIRHLEDTGALTKTGKKLWDTPKLLSILKMHAYAGVKYFNRKTSIKPDDRLNQKKHKYGKIVYKNKSEWIGVKVPAIVSQELFDKAQERIANSQKQYRNPMETQLLSKLVRCGSCGLVFTSYRRYCRKYYYYKGKRMDKGVYHKVAYRCSRRSLQRMHSPKLDILRCKNPEVASWILESCVFKMIKNIMTNPFELKGHLDRAKDKEHLTHLKIEDQLVHIADQLQKLTEEKRGVLNLYISGNLNRNMYAQKCLWYDNEINKLNFNKNELIKKIPILHKDEVIDISIQRYCQSVKTRLEKCLDFDSKRQFLLDYIEEIFYTEGKVKLVGSIQIKLKSHEDSNQSSEDGKIGFSIESVIDKTTISRSQKSYKMLIDKETLPISAE